MRTILPGLRCAAVLGDCMHVDSWHTCWGASAAGTLAILIYPPRDLALLKDAGMSAVDVERGVLPLRKQAD